MYDELMERLEILRKSLFKRVYNEEITEQKLEQFIGHSVLEAMARFLPVEMSDTMNLGLGKCSATAKSMLGKFLSEIKFFMKFVCDAINKLLERHQ